MTVTIDTCASVRKVLMYVLLNKTEIQIFEYLKDRSPLFDECDLIFNYYGGVWLVYNSGILQYKKKYKRT